MDRWISNEGKISSGCRSNEGAVEYVTAPEPEVTMPKAVLPIAPIPRALSPIAAITKAFSPIPAMPTAVSQIYAMPKAISPIAAMPKAVSPCAGQPQSNRAMANVKDDGSVKSSCSENDVLKFFRDKRRNARKVNQCQTKTIDSEWVLRQEKLNKLSIESKSKKPSAPVALAYTSLNKEVNVSPNRSEPVALPSMASAWSRNDTITTQKVRV